MANREILKESDKTTLQTQPDSSDAIYEKIAREAYVIGVAPITGAIKDGYKSITEHPGETGLAVATTFGIGLGLGYFSRGAGLGGLIARGAGAAFGVQFAREVASPQRWSIVRDTIADTWHNQQNFDRNVKTMEGTMGRFVFDTTLMLGGGIAGAKLGHGLGARLAMRPTNSLELKLAAAEAGLPMSARLTEIQPGELSGRRFRADVKSGESTPWDVAEGIIKPRKSYSLSELGELQRNMLVSKDAPALEAKGRIESITKEGAALQTEIRTLNQQLANTRAELKSAQELAKETQAVQRAKADVETLKARGRELPQKEAQLRALEEQIRTQQKAREDAQKHQEGEGGKKGKGGDKGEKANATEQVDLRGQARELKEEINRTRSDLNDKDPNSAINRARVRQAEAEQSLQAAQEAQPGRVQALETRLKEIEAAIEGKKAAHDDLGMQLREAIKGYETRVAELMADNTKLVERQRGSEPAQIRADKPAREPKGGDKGKTDGPGKTGEKTVETDKGAPKQPEVKKEAVVEKPAEVAKAPEVLAAERADAALKTAREATTEYAQKNEILKAARDMKAQALKDRAEIESGKKTFETAEARAAALEETLKLEAKATADMAKVGKVQYFRSLNVVNEYAKATENYLAAETNAAKRDVYVREAVKNIEEMMQLVPNSFKGHGGEKGIPSQSRGMTPEKRLAQLREHLDSRLGKMNAEHDARVRKSAEVPIVQDALTKVNSGQIKQELRALAEATINPRIPAAQRARIVEEATNTLYENSTIAFFERGKLVQNKGTDGNLHQQLFDVAKVERGQGRLDRLIGHTPEGYALVVPKLRSDGKLIEIARRGGGKPGDKPTFAKEVVQVAGNVPEGVGKGTSFGEILKKFKGAPEPVVAQSANKVEAKAAPAVEPATSASVEAAKVEPVGDHVATGSAYEAVAPKTDAVAAAETARPVELTTGGRTVSDATLGKTELTPESGS